MSGKSKLLLSVCCHVYFGCINSLHRAAHVAGSGSGFMLSFVKLVVKLFIEFLGKRKT